mmetsp:Transcript_34386/g.86112  ORF Transcript_34386/g.86112 Transcript_34386/m.86112 type:complete len:242 (-) Transcript_34386:108-833(-)
MAGEVEEQDVPILGAAHEPVHARHDVGAGRHQPRVAHTHAVVAQHEHLRVGEPELGLQQVVHALSVVDTAPQLRLRARVGAAHDERAFAAVRLAGGARARAGGGIRVLPRLPRVLRQLLPVRLLAGRRRRAPVLPLPGRSGRVGGRGHKAAGRRATAVLRRSVMRGSVGRGRGAAVGRGRPTVGGRRGRVAALPVHHGWRVRLVAPGRRGGRGAGLGHAVGVGVGVAHGRPPAAGTQRAGR